MLVYVKDKDLPSSYVVTLQVGTGDNLLPEDIDDGYAGYINYYVDRFVGHYEDDCGFVADDSGMYMCTSDDMKHIEGGNMKYLLDSIMDYIFNGSNISYVIMNKETEE